jgi:hypothetical protein
MRSPLCYLKLFELICQGKRKKIMKIEKEDAPLYIDVVCAVCKKRMALSNAHEKDGVYYCYFHFSKLEERQPVLLIVSSYE